MLQEAADVYSTNFTSTRQEKKKVPELSKKTAGVGRTNPRSLQRPRRERGPARGKCPRPLHKICKLRDAWKWAADSHVAVVVGSEEAVGVVVVSPAEAVRVVAQDVRVVAAVR